jgi:hypothetical protein
MFSSKVDTVIVEDSYSGFQFFKSVFSNCNVFSADGNSNVYNCIENESGQSILVIVDGAAFGAYIEKCLNSASEMLSKRISLWLPESFEYLILRSGIVRRADVDSILESPVDYIDSEQFVSWERFFTWLLEEVSAETDFKYSKQKLNPYYLQDGSKEVIIDSFPPEVKQLCHKTTERIFVFD